MELLVDVIGMKAFRGKVQGETIDSGTLFAVVRLDERYNRKEADSHNHKCGHAVEEWKMPSAEHVLRMAHLKPSISNPVTMRLEVERVSNGKESKEQVIDCSPVQSAAPARQPAQVHQVPVAKAA
jgi:hypothetical protein